MDAYIQKLFDELGINQTSHRETNVSPNGIEHKVNFYTTNIDLVRDIIAKCYVADIGKSEKDIKILCANVVGAARLVSESDVSNISKRIEVLNQAISEFDKATLE